MKRAILAVSAALLLLASTPALADGYRERHRGFDDGRRHGHYVQPRHFGGHFFWPYVKPGQFGIFIYRPHLKRHDFRDRHRSHFGRHGDRHFKRRHFDDRRHRHRR